MKNTHLLFTQDYLHEFVGLTYDAFDCYELVRLFYRKIFEYDLDCLYASKPESKEAVEIVDQHRHKFVEVTNPTFGDIILISIAGLPCHVGIYLDEKTFLHSREGVGSAIDKLSNWKKRIKGFYRCPELELD